VFIDGSVEDAGLRLMNRASGVKANSWGGISGQDPVLKGKKKTRTKMDERLMGEDINIEFQPSAIPRKIFKLTR
jgi:hypothetical protein